MARAPEGARPLPEESERKVRLREHLLFDDLSVPAKFRALRFTLMEPN